MEIKYCLKYKMTVTLLYKLDIFFPENLCELWGLLVTQMMFIIKLKAQMTKCKVNFIFHLNTHFLLLDGHSVTLITFESAS